GRHPAVCRRTDHRHPAVERFTPDRHRDTGWQRRDHLRLGGRPGATAERPSSVDHPALDGRCGWPGDPARFGHFGNGGELVPLVAEVANDAWQCPRGRLLRGWTVEVKFDDGTGGDVVHDATVDGLFGGGGGMVPS